MAEREIEIKSDRDLALMEEVNAEWHKVATTLYPLLPHMDRLVKSYNDLVEPTKRVENLFGKLQRQLEELQEEDK